MRLLVLVISVLYAVTASAEPVDYSLPDVHGKKHSLADYRGKWVVVNYWATWCPPCQEEIPDLVTLAAAQDGPRIIGISLDLAVPGARGESQVPSIHLLILTFVKEELIQGLRDCFLPFRATLGRRTRPFRQLSGDGWRGTRGAPASTACRCPPAPRRAGGRRPPGSCPAAGSPRPCRRARRPPSR